MAHEPGEARPDRRWGRWVSEEPGGTAQSGRVAATISPPATPPGHGAAITVTKNGRPVARIVSTNAPPHLTALIADRHVRAQEAPLLPQRALPDGPNASSTRHNDEEYLRLQ